MTRTESWRDNVSEGDIYDGSRRMGRWSVTA